MNLLTDPLISVETADGHERLDLPGVLAAIASKRVRTFPRVRPHHAHAWHVFLVQTGALAVVGSGATAPPNDAGTWRDMLRTLAGGGAAWNLIAGSPEDPAFMQPPQPADAPPLRKVVTTPDDLDVVFTSREHGQKSGRIVADSPEDWINALIAVQTLSGMAGPHNKRIMRMQGARGARPFVSLTPDPLPGTHVRRDLLAVLHLRGRRAGATCRAPALLWTLPWRGDADEMIPARDLDPLCVEVCRRIRLRVTADGTTVARAGGTRAPRTEAAIDNRNGLGGDVGDPWTPLRTDRRTAVRPRDGELSVRDAARIVFDRNTFHPAPLQQVLPVDPDADMTCILRFLTFGACSARLSERRIAVPRRMRPFILDRGAPRDAGRVAGDMFDDAEKVRSRALRPAVLAHLQDGARDPAENVDHEDPEVRQVLADYDATVDRIFTDHLHRRVTGGGADRDDWLDALEDAAGSALDALRRRSRCDSARDFSRRTARARLQAGVDAVAGRDTGEPQ